MLVTLFCSVTCAPVNLKERHIVGGGEGVLIISHVIAI